MKGGQWLLLAVVAILALTGGGLLVSSLPAGSVPPIVQQFADAIAQAEGFYVSGSVPNRKNNPGDIESSGQIIQYPTVNDGWQALYNQVYLMFYGGSAHYNPSMSITEVAWIYADGADDPVGAQNWASNVAQALGVTTDTTLQNLLDGSAST